MKRANSVNAGGGPVAGKIMLIRHAEKPPSKPPPHGIDLNGDHDKESLIVRGWQRAGALAVFFAPSVGNLHDHRGFWAVTVGTNMARATPGPIATPQTIYASMITKHSNSERPQETVSALVAKLGDSATVNFDFAKGKEAEVAASAMGCNGVVLICWEHQSIPAITKGFPISPDNPTPVPSDWPDDRYDVVWVFDLDSTGGYCFTEVPQLLLAGDGPV